MTRRGSEESRETASRPRPRPGVAAAMLALGLALLAYTGLRASVLSFTYDEAWTTYYVEDPVGETLSGATGSANNHMLNTVLMKVSRRLLGAGDLPDRLPNLAAHALYLLASALVALRLAGGGFLGLAGFALLNLNPFMLDFFSLARGYGLALSLMMAALAALLAEAASPSWRRRLAACVLAALAVLASFPLLLVFMALGGLLGLMSLQRLWLRPRRGGALVRGWLAEMAGPLAVALALAAVIQRPVRILRYRKELYFGGVDGFWADTVGSLVRASLYDDRAPAWAVRSGQVAVALALVAVVAAAVVQLRSRGWRLARSPQAQVTALLLAAGIGSALQHELLGVRLLLERTALFLVPLLMAAVAGALVVAAGAGRGRIPATAAAVLLAGLAAVHTAGAANLTHTYSWRFDAATRDVIDRITALRAQGDDPGGKVRLLMSWPFKMSVRYYIRTRELDWLNEAVYDYVAEKGGYDYLYLLTEDFDVGFAADRELLDSHPDRILDRYPVSGAVLMAGSGNGPPAAAAPGEEAVSP